jgi:quinolinate synthase
MAMNGLVNLASVLEATDGRNQIHVDPETGRQAKKAIDRMLDFAAAKKAKALPTGPLEQEGALFKGIGPA